MAGIALRTYGTDSNPAGPSGYCSIPVPVGVQDGDIVLVGIAATSFVDSLGGFTIFASTVLPPDSSWTSVPQTDTAQYCSMCFFWKRALNETGQWVFSTTNPNPSATAVYMAGAAAVFANADSFGPIDGQSFIVTTGSATHAVPAVAASQAGEVQVLFVGAAGNGTWTPATGFQQIAAKQQLYASISLQQKSLPAAGSQGATTEAFSGGVATGAAVTVTLAPSAARSSLSDVYARLFDALPRGIDSVLDFTPGTGDFYKYFLAASSVVKFGFDLIDLLRQEVAPHTSRYKLPDWERFFGLQGTRTTQLGTVPQRQQQVLGAWRAAAAQSASMQTVQSVFAALFGYNPGTTPQIVEASRGELTMRHQVGIASADVTITNGSTATLTPFVVDDGGVVAKMGAQLSLYFSGTFVGNVTLTAPSGQSYTWTGLSRSDLPVFLAAQSLAGATCAGPWTLSVTNNSGGTLTLYAASTLLVEGMQRGQSTAGAMFDWGVYADPAHLGENGTAPDLAAARRAAQRIGHEHSIGNILQSLTPYPNTDSGVNAAIPDECIPT